MIYRERLTVPAAWWLLGGLFALSALVAVGWYRGVFWGVTTGLAATAIAGAIFAAASVTITVNAAELAVGRARIELSYLSGAIPLDKQAVSDRAGRAPSREYGAGHRPAGGLRSACQRGSLVKNRRARGEP